MSALSYLSPDQLVRALALRDLSDPAQGAHSMQLLLQDLVTALQHLWSSSVRQVRNPPLVAVHDNYDRLGYEPDDVTRAQRYTRYVSPTVLLRTHTSAELPTALQDYRGRSDIDELLVVPGLVHRRDVVDRTHVGEPHQVDLWRIRSTPHTTDEDMLDMITTLVEAVLPGTPWQISDVEHPYTVGGRQVDVNVDGEWLELAECGRIHPDVLRRSGLAPEKWSGLALGMGLERALMVRKSIPDIRYLRSSAPRIAAQMLDLEPWRHVSLLPGTRRDISVVLNDSEDGETVGDRVRTALGEDADLIEAVDVLSLTRYEELPAGARDRLGIDAGQSNALIRIHIRPLVRTITSAEANGLRNKVYLALHEGPHAELI
ncbi:PheS-related mystery ligase SrmL [Kocuria nitroreducens]|uniref:PheS-related mystery ligase SrmL n=1 Tax=Kocuria nitroreducens TaxID=3058914 RepID=UPI0036DD2DD4